MYSDTEMNTLAEAPEVSDEAPEVSDVEILEALSTVPDPDLGKDLVTLKMIKNVWYATATSRF